MRDRAATLNGRADRGVVSVCATASAEAVWNSRQAHCSPGGTQWHTRMLLGIVLCLLTGAANGDVTGWRGDGTGRFPEAEPPREWDIDQGTNILWQATVGKGQSSPIVVRERAFITAEQDWLLCLDRASGKILWKKDNGFTALPPEIPAPRKRPPADPRCGYSTPTPLSDGEFVYVVFGTGVVACYDSAGQRKWIRCFEQEQATEYGRTASPILVHGRLLVSVTGLLALDPQTGAVLWEQPRAKAAYGTPVTARAGGLEVLVTPNGDCVRLSDGKLLATKLGRTEFPSPVADGTVVYFVDRTAAAVRLAAESAESVKATKLWEVRLEGEFFAAPVCHERILYCVNNEGILWALDAKTGTTIYRQELAMPAARNTPAADPVNIYASLTIAGPHLLVSNDAGDTLVLAPGRQHRQVAHNYLDKGSGASPAADGKHLLLRGGQKLYCIGLR